MEEQLVETWQIHNRINLYLLNAVAPEALDCQLNGKGRSVFKQFAHIHNVRHMWLKAAAPELLEGVEKIDAETGTKEQLVAALTASGAATEKLLRKAVASGKVKGFKGSTVAFLGYCIAHESHHRGQIGWTLKYSGHPLDKKTAFGLWEWGVR
jgi:uncharacterized damage-inducible protein DinB